MQKTIDQITYEQNQKLSKKLLTKAEAENAHEQQTKKSRTELINWMFERG